MKILRYPIFSKYGILVCSLTILLLLIVSIRQSPAGEKVKTGTVRKVNIVIEEDYGPLQPTNSRVSRWMPDDLKKIFIELGFEIIPQKDQCDFCIQIRLSGVPIQAAYQEVGNLYAGAEISGDIRFETPGKMKFIRFSGKASPPTPLLTFKDELKSPDQAPFNKAYQYSDFMLGMAEAVEALFEIPKEKFLVVAMLESSARDKAGDELTNIGIGAAPYLAEVLNNPGQKFEARIKAAEAMGNIGLNDTSVLEPLHKAMEDNAKHLRWTAAMAIAKISKKPGGVGEAYTQKAVSVLAPYLAQGQDPFMSQESIIALGDLGNELAVAPLIRSLESVQGNFFLTHKISEALTKITGLNFGSDAQKWLEWWQDRS